MEQRTPEAFQMYGNEKQIPADNKVFFPLANNQPSQRRQEPTGWGQYAAAVSALF